jgi:hypothetical protein
MDIAGAKALKERLGSNEADETPFAAGASVGDAPPVFNWFGVRHREPEAQVQAADVDDRHGARTASLLRRLGLSFR